MPGQNNPKTVRLRTEIIAGFTTFFTMAYIIAVNPAILSNVGMDYGAVFVATCLAASLGSFLMGVLANYPIALAPSMSLNAYFAFYVIQQLHYSWQEALGIVLVSGILFALLTFTKVRQWLIYKMPDAIKLGIASGIGLFLIEIALKNLKFDFNHALININVWLCILGVFLTVIFDKFNVIGSILISMLIVTFIGSFFNLVTFYGFIAFPPSISPSFLQLTLPALHDGQTLIVILIFLFVALFDNTGTLISILHEGKLLPKKSSPKENKHLNRALLADSLASISGAIFGTSPTGSYIESAAGVREGGRTGITAIIVGILFLLALFLAPLAKSIPQYATATALIYVGMLMTKNLILLPFKDWTESLPGLLCALIIPISFSIADGVAVGFISYLVLKLLTKKFNDLDISLWIICFLSLSYLYIRIG